jgi:hypothetical protein
VVVNLAAGPGELVRPSESAGPTTAPQDAVVPVLPPPQVLSLPGGPRAPRTDSIEESARLFYNGHYDAAADMDLRLRASAPEDLASYERRSSALHFQLKREVAAAGHPRDRDRALRACERCAALIAAIKADVEKGRALARARLDADPHDIDALFFLGKLDLTHVWLHNDTLGERTGWSEYREARRVLDDVLEQQPDHMRARVSRAYIDYIVDTRVPWAFRWILGGGNKKRALATLRETVSMPGTPAMLAEARFALWEMLTREGQTTEATALAAALSVDYPENLELQRFLAQSAR